jgi:hypothetical protein
MGVMLGGFTSTTTEGADWKFNKLFNGLNAPAPEKSEVLPDSPETDGLLSCPCLSAIAFNRTIRIFKHTEFDRGGCRNHELHDAPTEGLIDRECTPAAKLSGLQSTGPRVWDPEAVAED